VLSLLRAVALLALATAAACGAETAALDQGAQSDARADTVPDAALETAARDASADLSSPVEGLPVARVCAILLDPAGAAVPDTNAIVCDGAACNMATSDAAGALCVAVDVQGVFKFNSFERISGGKHYGEVLFPVTVTQQQIDARVKLALGQVVVPLMGPAVALDAKVGGTLALTGGVSLQVPAGAASQPSLNNIIDVAAAQVAPKDLHARLLATGPAKAPVVAIHLVPAEVAFSPPAGYALPAGGLSPGSALQVYGVDYDTGELELRGEARVDSAGQITGKVGQGLTSLGWFLFYTK
jgi:hypothetical protein